MFGEKKEIKYELQSCTFRCTCLTFKELENMYNWMGLPLFFFHVTRPHLKSCLLASENLSKFRIALLNPVHWQLASLQKSHLRN